MSRSNPNNIDEKVVEGFGEEWNAFDQISLGEVEHRELFEKYFSIFPFEGLPPEPEGFDLGCGSGRWAALMAERVGSLHCIDPAAQALAVARKRLQHIGNITFSLAGAHDIPLADASQDFGYSLGVLHHIPDTEMALRSCIAKLKIGAPFLLYLYYSFDNKPIWFVEIWRISEHIRNMVSRMPFTFRRSVTTTIAAIVYWPMARLSLLLEKCNIDPSNIPLSFYRSTSFYTMRTDALDRFGTSLEQRFSRADIEAMMLRAGLGQIRFRDATPYWVACGAKVG